jgi:hypothetical protein
MRDFKAGDKFIRHRASGDKVYTRNEEGRWYLPNANWSFDDSDVERGMTLGYNWSYQPVETDEPVPAADHPAAPDEPERSVENSPGPPVGDVPREKDEPRVTRHKGFWEKFTE